MFLVAGGAVSWRSKKQETVARNIIASGAGGEDFEHFFGSCLKFSSEKMFTMLN